MLKISYPNVLLGAYFYACAAMDSYSLGQSIIETQTKVDSVAGNLFSSLVDWTASASWAVLWTHSVDLICIGTVLPFLEGICFGAFGLSYGLGAGKEWVEIRARWEASGSVKGDEALWAEEELLKSGFWKLIGTVSLAAWSVLNLMKVVVAYSPDPAVVLFLLLFGFLSKAVAHMYKKRVEQEGASEACHV